ncbi:hypothetical protein CPB86DRAFT_781993 [Serendipita vermifera]|nr:hypothetical protein CPB86DRAFT_781993 [Serendipita vermifera]
MSSDGERTLRKRRSNVSRGSASTESHDAHRRRSHSPAPPAKDSILKPLKERFGIAKSGKEQLKDSVEDTFAFMIFLILDITKMALQLLKQPIAFVLVGYLLIVMISYTAHYVASLVLQGLMPLCSLPLISMVPICSRIPSTRNSSGGRAGGTYVQEPRYMDLVELQTRFEAIMESTGMDTNLAMDLKNSEMAVRDLNTLVKLSDIVSKDLLASSLDEFVSSAKEASRHLSKLDAGVGGAVDSILAMDDYAIKTLESLDRQEKEKTALSSILFPFSSSASTRKQLIQTFNQAAGILESNLRRLIETSVATTTILNQLESQLLVIHEIVSREEGKVKAGRDEVLGDLWTYVGANRAKLSNFASHKSLLSQVGHYRSSAAVQVGGTLVQLERLSSDLDELRERVATPVLLDSQDGIPSIPIEVHVMTLQKGVQRLAESRGRSKNRADQVLKRILEGPQYPELPSH